MYTVYLLKSLSTPGKTYIGYTSNLRKRLKEHNSGATKTTKPFTPWEVEVAISFKEEAKAKTFEQYLKHGSGFAFAKKHFW